MVGVDGIGMLINQLKGIIEEIDKISLASPEFDVIFRQ
jgi:hypothetical protein